MSLLQVWLWVGPPEGVLKRQGLEELGSKVVVDGYKRDELMGSNLRGLAYCMLRVWKRGAQEPEK